MVLSRYSCEKRTHLRTLVVVALLVLARSMGVAAQLSSTPAELAWVGLFNSDLIGWLENENRLNDLCPASITAAEARDQCRGAMLKPRIFLATLRMAPDASAPSGGSMLLVAEPGQGMRFYYIRPDGGQAREFTPDVYLADWGYGPSYHQTLSRSTWRLVLASSGSLPRGHLVQRGRSR